jgi:hypothetical protein
MYAYTNMRSNSLLKKYQGDLIICQERQAHWGCSRCVAIASCLCHVLFSEEKPKRVVELMVSFFLHA